MYLERVIGLEPMALTLAKLRSTNWAIPAIYCYLYLIHGGSGEIRTHGPLPVVCFQDRCINPLCHTSLFGSDGRTRTYDKHRMKVLHWPLCYITMGWLMRFELTLYRITICGTTIMLQSPLFGLGWEIRTPDILVPNQAVYQADLIRVCVVLCEGLEPSSPDYKTGILAFEITEQIWQGHLESNQEWRNQNPWLYRLTIPQLIGVQGGTRTPTNSFGDCYAAITPPRHFGVRSRIRTDGFRVLQTLALGHSAILTFGTGTRARTENLLVKSQLLYLWVIPAE